jgi:hypothetical protein
VGERVRLGTTFRSAVQISSRAFCNEVGFDAEPEEATNNLLVSALRCERVRPSCTERNQIIETDFRHAELLSYLHEYSEASKNQARFSLYIRAAARFERHKRINRFLHPDARLLQGRYGAGKFHFPD